MNYKKIFTRPHIRLLFASLLFWVPCITFCYLSGEVLEQEPLNFDIVVLHWIHAHSSTPLDRVFLSITTLGNAEIIAPITLLFIAIFWYWQHKRSAVLIAASFGGAALANVILKLLFHRQRPSFWPSLLHETSYSFPSGHAMASSALVFALITVSWRTIWRWPILGISILFVSLVGYSRLYLGVHYPTDVVAGWCASLTWVLIANRLVNHWPSRNNVLVKTKR